MMRLSLHTQTVGFEICASVWAHATKQSSLANNRYRPYLGPGAQPLRCYRQSSVNTDLAPIVTFYFPAIFYRGMTDPEIKRLALGL